MIIQSCDFTSRFCTVFFYFILFINVLRNLVYCKYISTKRQRAIQNSTQTERHFENSTKKECHIEKQYIE